MLKFLTQCLISTAHLHKVHTQVNMLLTLCFLMILETQTPRKGPFLRYKYLPLHVRRLELWVLHTATRGVDPRPQLDDADKTQQAVPQFEKEFRGPRLEPWTSGCEVSAELEYKPSVILPQAANVTYKQSTCQRRSGGCRAEFADLAGGELILSLVSTPRQPALKLIHPVVQDIAGNQ